MTTLHKHNIIPIGIIDGSNKIFQVPDTYIPNTIQIYVNGLFQAKEHFIELVPNGFELNEAPLNNIYTDVVHCSYDIDSLVSFPSTSEFKTEIHHKVNVIPEGILNGINTRFRTPNNYISGTLKPRLRGLAEIEFSEASPSEFVLNEAPLLNDFIDVSYDSWAIIYSETI